MPFPIMLALAAAQMASAANKEQRQKKLASTTQALSPWTGLKAEPVDYADPIATGMQAYGAYKSDQQATEDRSANKGLIDAQTKYFDAMAEREAQAEQARRGMNMGQQDARAQAGVGGYRPNSYPRWWD